MVIVADGMPGALFSIRLAFSAADLHVSFVHL